MTKLKPFNPARAKRKLDSIWSAIVRKRDGQCTFCGKADGKLDANHIFSRRHMATRWDVRNGNTLDFCCHRRFHDDPLWGAAKARELIGEELYEELFLLSRKIQPFDRAFYAVKLVELEKYL